MKRTKSLATLVAAVLMAGGWCQTAMAATASGTANASVLTPISISPGLSLEFGTFAAPGAGTVVVASSTGARTPTGGVVLAGGTARAGTFSVSGTGNATFGVTYPSAFTISNGSETMSVTVTGDSSGTLSGGNATLNVGGTVTVGANQAAGSYTGTYTMTVEYN